MKPPDRRQTIGQMKLKPQSVSSLRAAGSQGTGVLKKGARFSATTLELHAKTATAYDLRIIGRGERGWRFAAVEIEANAVLLVNQFGHQECVVIADVVYDPHPRMELPIKKAVWVGRS